MDFRQFIEGYRHPFQVGKGTVLRFLFYAALSLFLGTVGSIPMGDDFRVSLMDTVLYLSIYSLPVGWAFISTAVMGMLSYLLYDQWQYALVMLMVKGIAILVAKGLFAAAGDKKTKGALYPPMLWCFFVVLSGYCCYDIVLYGALAGILRLMGRALEWMLCAVLALVLLNMPGQRENRALLPVYHFLGWEE